MSALGRTAKSEQLVAEDALLDQLAHGFDFAVVRGLPIVFDEASRESGCLAPVVEGRARQRLAHHRSLVN